MHPNFRNTPKLPNRLATGGSDRCAISRLKVLRSVRDDRSIPIAPDLGTVSSTPRGEHVGASATTHAHRRLKQGWIIPQSLDRLVDVDTWCSSSAASCHRRRRQLGSKRHNTRADMCSHLTRRKNVVSSLEILNILREPVERADTCPETLNARSTSYRHCHRQESISNSRSIIVRKNDYYRLLREVTADGAWIEWIRYMRARVVSGRHSTRTVSASRGANANTWAAIPGATPRTMARAIPEST
jgi:hypothetical protein